MARPDLAGGQQFGQAFGGVIVRGREVIFGVEPEDDVDLRDGGLIGPRQATGGNATSKARRQTGVVDDRIGGQGYRLPNAGQNRRGPGTAGTAITDAGYGTVLVDRRRIPEAIRKPRVRGRSLPQESLTVRTALEPMPR